MLASIMTRGRALLGLALFSGAVLGACGDKDSEDTGHDHSSHTTDDTSAGGDDTSAGGDDTSAGGDDTSAGGDDTSAGGDDTSAGGDDTSAGGDDTSAGGDDTAAATPCEGETPGTGVGECATDFTLVDQDGVNRSLYDYYGQVIVLDFSPFW